jgi:uncharacterized protein (DUF433 family)
MATEALIRYIESTPDIMGGKPRIAGHRISVQDVAVWHEYRGKSPDEIATEYSLTLAQVHAALSYYFEHRSEIDQAISEAETFADELRLRTPSKLTRKLQERKRHGANG